MSQSDFGDLESPLTGAEFINSKLEPWRDAVHTMHSGSSRPSYAVAGLMWLDTTTSPWVLKMFNGISDDMPIGYFDPTAKTFFPLGYTIWAGSAGGSANALTLTPTPAISSYPVGVPFEFLATAANTGAGPTVSISSLTAQNLRCSIGGAKVALPKGAIQSGMILRIVYDGTDFIVLNVRPYNISAAMASASTLNLNNTTGDYLHITGTTPITAITLLEGLEKTCVADAAFTLTNGASLILPGAANITAAAGDSFVVRGEASGVVRVVNYMRADGSSIAGASNTKVCSAYHNTTQSLASNSTSILALNSEDFDPSSWHSTVTNNSRITVDFTGYVRVTAQWAMNSVTAGFTQTVTILKNGVDTNIKMQLCHGTSLSNQKIIQASGLVAVSSGDYIEMSAYHDYGSSQNALADSTRLMVERI